MQACGHLYLDEGEELETGQSRENLLAFEAFTMSNSSGQVRPSSAALLLVSTPRFNQPIWRESQRLVTERTPGMQVSLSWPGAFGGGMENPCKNSTAWPVLDKIVLLGASVQSTLTLQASQHSGVHSVEASCLLSWVS